jgi:Holliday junction resolvase RusA-like endonuclease
MYSDEIINDLLKTTRIYKSFIQCVPPRTTHQAGNRIFKRKGGGYFIGKSQKHKRTKSYLKNHLSLNAPPSPYSGNIKIKVLWIYPWRSNETKKNKQLGIMPCNKRPDCDNIAKGLLDAMQETKWFADDGNIYNLNITKYYGEQFGIYIEMSESIMHI